MFSKYKVVIQTLVTGKKQIMSVSLASFANRLVAKNPNDTWLDSLEYVIVSASNAKDAIRLALAGRAQCEHCLKVVAHENFEHQETCCIPCFDRLFKAEYERIASYEKLEYDYVFGED